MHEVFFIDKFYLLNDTSKRNYEEISLICLYFLIFYFLN